MENKIIYVSAAVVLVLIYVVATYEPVTNGDVKTYFCSKDAFYAYLKKMVDFKKGPNETLVYPDDFDYSTQIPIEDIKKMVEKSCTNPYGVPDEPYLNDTMFYWKCWNKYGSRCNVSSIPSKNLCHCKTVCSIPLTDGRTLGLWGFWINDKGHVVPDSARKQLDGDRMSWRNGFIFVDIGLCFQE